MILTRRLRPDADEATIQGVIDHVRAELSASAAADDDPETNADDVQVNVYPIAAGTKGLSGETFTEDCLIVVGILDMEPDAPYLRDDFDPYEGVPLHLRMHAVDDPGALPPLKEVKGGSKHERGN